MNMEAAPKPSTPVRTMGGIIEWSWSAIVAEKTM